MSLSSADWDEEMTGRDSTGKKRPGEIVRAAACVERCVWTLRRKEGMAR